MLILIQLELILEASTIRGRKRRLTNESRAPLMRGMCSGTCRESSELKNLEKVYSQIIMRWRSALSNPRSLKGDNIRRTEKLYILRKLLKGGGREQEIKKLKNRLSSM